ncbi:unnamed protein product [Effrenium voratum]|nr:unnamed protein product [Effrenium voratum]
MPLPSPRHVTSQREGIDGESFWGTATSPSEASPCHGAQAPAGPVRAAPWVRRAVSPHCAELLAELPPAQGRTFMAPVRARRHERFEGDASDCDGLQPLVADVDACQGFLRHASFRGCPLRRPFAIPAGPEQGDGFFSPRSIEAEREQRCPPEAGPLAGVVGSPDISFGGHVSLPGRALRRCVCSPIRSGASSDCSLPDLPAMDAGASRSSDRRSLQGSKVKPGDQLKRPPRPESAPCISSLVPQARTESGGAAAKPHHNFVKPRKQPKPSYLNVSANRPRADGSSVEEAIAAALDSGGHQLPWAERLPRKRYALSKIKEMPFALREPYPAAPPWGSVGINQLLAARRAALTKSGVLDRAVLPR